MSAIPTIGPFLAAAIINSPLRLVNWRCQWSSCSCRKCPQGGSTSSCPTLVPCATSLRERRLPGRWIRVECPWLRELVMDREAWRAAVHGVAKSRTRLSDWSEVKRMNTQGPVSHYFFPLNLHPFPLDSCLPGAPPPWWGSCLGDCTLRKEAWTGDHRTNRPGV